MMRHNEIAKIYAQADQARRKCLWPSCPNYAINSHLLQKKRILEIIADNGKLYKLQKNFFTLKMDFVKVGINEALSFKGFCNKHDTEIFKNIENGPLDFTRDDAKLLLNYRAIQHNIRKTEVNIDYAQKALKYVISKSEIWAASQLKGTLEGSIRKQENYLKHENQLFKSIQGGINEYYFSVIEAPVLGVAASAVHQIETRSDVLERSRMGFDSFKTSLLFIHIIPEKLRTLIVISCRNEAIAKASQIILEANVNPVKFVSDTLIKRIETWVCSSALYFKSLKPQSKRIILESEKYPIYADADEHLSLNMFSKWL